MSYGANVEVNATHTCSNRTHIIFVYNLNSFLFFNLLSLSGFGYFFIDFILFLFYFMVYLKKSFKKMLSSVLLTTDIVPHHSFFSVIKVVLKFTYTANIPRVLAESHF